MHKKQRAHNLSDDVICMRLCRFLHGFFFFIYFCGHISVKTMTSNREVRKCEAKNAAPEPLRKLFHAATKAAKEARVATMVAIAKLVDDAAVENGGRVPKGFVPKVIQRFSRVAPDLTGDQINHFIKKHKRSATTGSELIPELSPMTTLNDLPQDDAGPAKKRQKGGRRKGSTMKSSQTELESYQKAIAEAAQDYQNALFNSKEVRIGETALQRVRAQHQKKQAEQLKKDGKKADERRERRRKAMEVRALNRPEEQWNKAHLKAMCMYKKVPGDKGLPDSLPLLRQLWNERKGRLSPPVSPDNSDEESDDELNGFVAALSAARTPLSHVALNSPADVSTLSDITNTPPMHAPESEERFDVAHSGQGTM
jgi:hypothetical protein